MPSALLSQRRSRSICSSCSRLLRAVFTAQAIFSSAPELRVFDLQSESYPPTGSISADGIKNQLGRPKLDRLTLLVREAVQNSWDARLVDRGVRFGMAGWNLTDKQRSWLLDTLFKRMPPRGLDVRKLLGSPEPAAVLAIYDRGTKGLCGPTRADQAPTGEALNFVNLLRNVGQPPTAYRGGGTYGFGKTALFLASRARTIVVHSQVAAGRKFEQRFMGAALGSQYTHAGSVGRGRRYTGRHWWGRKDGSVVEPVTGRDASDAAKALGLPQFDREETGTTILVLLPDFEGRTPEEALRFIGEAILRTFWPKMVDGARGSGSMNFALSWNGIRIPMPRPQDVPPLGAYVKAFANLQAKLADKPMPHAGGWVQEIHSQRPARRLGTLSLLKFPPEPRLASASENEDNGPFQGRSHHTALMRGPHFVVNYLAGPTLPYELAEYAGVFVASPTAEEAYARSEPPTHDDWVPDILEDRTDKRLVNIGLRKIKEAMQEFAGVSMPDKVPSQGVPLGAFSDLLGGLIPGERGTGARGGAGDAGGFGGGGGNRGENGGAGTGGRGRGGARATRVRIMEAGEPDSIAGANVPVFTVAFDLEPAQRTEKLTIVARPGVLLEDGSMESEPPLGADKPEVLFWSNAAGKVVSRAQKLTVGPNEKGPWTVALAMPQDAAVAVELDLETTR